MKPIYMDQNDLLECYIEDVNKYDEMFLSISVADEVTILKNKVYLIINTENEIKAIYGLNGNGIREYLNVEQIQSIRFCKRSKNRIVDAISEEED